MGVEVDPPEERGRATAQPVRWSVMQHSQGTFETAMTGPVRRYGIFRGRHIELPDACGSQRHRHYGAMNGL